MLEGRGCGGEQGKGGIEVLIYCEGARAMAGGHGRVLCRPEKAQIPFCLVLLFNLM